MGMLFDSSMYGCDVLANDIFYYLSKFRINSKFSKLNFKDGITGDFSVFGTNDLFAFFNDLIMVVQIAVDNDGSPIVEYMTYDEYLILKDIRTDLNLQIDFDNIFIGFQSDVYIDFNDFNDYTSETVFLNLGNDRHCLKLKSLLSEIDNGNVSFDSGVSYDFDGLSTSGYSIDYLEFSKMVLGSKFSIDYPIDMLNFIKPKINNPFLYPTYFSDKKEISVGDINVSGGGGGSSALTSERVNLIIKLMSKLLLVTDPFEREDEILKAAGILNAQIPQGGEEN